MRHQSGGVWNPRQLRRMYLGASILRNFYDMAMNLEGIFLNLCATMFKFFGYNELGT